MIYLLLGIALFALCYWLFMSPYSQFFGPYTYKKPHTNKKVVALTFDDGPNEPFTSELATFLHAEGIHATFFQVAQAVQANPNVSKKLLKAGHTIGNHSHSHRFMNYFLHPSFRHEITQAQQIFQDALDITPALFRSPWLFRSPLLLKTLKKQGLTPISGVFCHDLEVAQIPAERIAQTAVKRTKPGTILIFHDGYNGKTADRTQTIAAIKLTVKKLKDDGYQFVTVDELLGIKPYL